MRTVWKVPVSPSAEVQNLYPTGPDRFVRPIALNEQGGGLTMWLEVVPDTDDPHGMAYAVIGTGWDVPPGMEHVDTHLTDGGYVWHLYRNFEP